MSISQLLRKSDDPLAQLLELLEESRKSLAGKGLKDAKKYFSTLQSKLSEVQSVINRTDFDGAITDSIRRNVDSVQLSAEAQAVYKQLQQGERQNALNDVEKYCLNQMKEFCQTQSLDKPVNITTRLGTEVSLYSSGNGKLMASITQADGNKQEFEVTSNTLITEDKEGKLIVREVNGVTLSGTDGDDVLINLYAHKVKGYGGNDHIVSLNNMLQAVDLDTGDGDDTVTSGNLWDANISAGDGNDQISIGNAFLSSIDAGAGNDNVKAQNLVQVLVELGEGDDSLEAENVFLSSIDAGNGNNKLLLENVVGSSIVSGDGDDDITVNNIVESTVSTGGGNDNIVAKNMRDLVINTGSGDDSVQAVTIDGGIIDTGDGNDFIKGNAITGQTRITTGEGNDIIQAMEITGSQTFLGDGAALNSISIDMGNGNNALVVGNRINNASIQFGDGDDTIQADNIGSGLTGDSRAHSVYIEMGKGNNSLTVDNDIVNAYISGNGKNEITVGGNIQGSTLNGGEGVTNIIVYGYFMNNSLIGDGNPLVPGQDTGTNGSNGRHSIAVLGQLIKYKDMDDQGNLIDNSEIIRNVSHAWG